MNTVEDSDNKRTVIANQNEKINDSARRISDADDDEDETDDDNEDKETEYDINEDSQELFDAVAYAFSCDADEAKKIIAVARMKGDDYNTMLDYSFDNNDEVTVGDDRYRVFAGEYELEDYAVESVEDGLEYDMGIEGLSEWAQQEAIEKFCSYDWEDDMHESNLGYANDIVSEEGSDGYKNRLIEEAVERGVISDDDLDEDGDYNGGDYDSLIDDFADDMDSDYNTMSEWFESMYGRGWAREVSKSLKNYFDWHGIAQWVVDTDGASSQVDVYATEEIDGEDYYIIEY